MSDDVSTSDPTPPVTRDDIVVGMDDTPTSRAAVTWALDAARAGGQRVVLVRAVDPGGYGLWAANGRLRHGVVDLYRPGLDRAVDAARAEAPTVDVRGTLRIGNVDTVMAHVAELGDQTVIGVRARSLTSRLVLGSVGHHLIRTSSRPVVLVPVPATAADLATSATERVVVALGGDTGSAAIAYGFETARRRHLPLTLLHADDHTDAWTDGARRGRPDLHAAVEVEQQAHPEQHVLVVTVPGDLDRVLTENVGDHDLLVLGTRVPRHPAAPVVDRVLLPLLRRPHQVVVVVPDHVPDHVTTRSDDREPALTSEVPQP